VAAVRRAANRVNRLAGLPQAICKEKLGTVQLTMANKLFIENNGKKAATLGKLLLVWLLEELHGTGWQLLLSADLDRFLVQAATLFFQRTTREGPGLVRVVCVAPGEWDKIILINHDERVKAAVVDAIEESWPPGVQSQETITMFDQTLDEIKMSGYPWMTAEANVDNNRIICQIVGRLSQLGLRLLAGVNIKGGTDSLFFITDPKTAKQSPDFCALSLCQRNRLRLVGCKDQAAVVREVCVQTGFRVQEETTREHHAKLNLGGSPWCSSGAESVRARQLVGRISEAMVGRGWALTDAVDISRREDDKSMLLFRRCPPGATRFCCIALTHVNNLRLVDFPPGDLEVMRDAATRHYLPGLLWQYNAQEQGSLKAKMSGRPWSTAIGPLLGWAVHARSLLVHLLATATALGYRPVVSADVSAKYGEPDLDNCTGPVGHWDSEEMPLDVHTIYLARRLPSKGGIEPEPDY
jgi:hypothetical protein